MRNQLQIFSSSEFGQVRTVEIDNEIYFVGVDVARSLFYSKPSQAVIDHCKGIRKSGMPSNGGIQETNVIPIGDICRLVAKAADQSVNPQIQEIGQRYEKWIFDEVLPSIHKTGQYLMSNKNDIELSESKLRAIAMERNSRTNQAKLMLKFTEIDKLSPEAVELISVEAAQMMLKKQLPIRPRIQEKLSTATEVGIKYGFSSNWIGKLSEKFSLKTDEFGIWVLDGKKNSEGQTDAFRYNEKGVCKLGELLKDSNNWPKNRRKEQKA